MPAPAAFGHHVGQLTQLRVVGAPGQQVGHDQQRLQDIAQVVTQTGREHRQAFQTLRAHQLAFHALAFQIRTRLADRADHRARQARRVVLDDVVVGAILQRLDRGLLTHGAGDEDEGCGTVLAHQAQRLVSGKARHAQVRQHDVRLEVVQRGAQRRLAVHALECRIQPGLEQLIGQQLGVFR